MRWLIILKDTEEISGGLGIRSKGRKKKQSHIEKCTINWIAKEDWKIVLFILKIKLQKYNILIAKKIK